MAFFGMLWGAKDLDENQQVEHQSGASRLLGSMCCAICGFPFFLIVSMVILGWNEKRAVCDTKAIAAGLEVVKEPECNAPSTYANELVMLQCNLEETGCCSGGTLASLKSSGDFATTLSGYVGTGLSVAAEMYQCVEHKHSETKKDNIGGGKTTINTYTYSREWKSSWVDSSTFHKVGSQAWQTGCGVMNPAWPGKVPNSGNYYAETAQAGDFALSSNFVKMVPITTAWSEGNAPSGWSKNGDNGGSYETMQYATTHNVGAMRVTFTGTNWASPGVTVLGENKAGTMTSWTAPSDWLCSGFTLGDLRAGSIDKETLFEALQTEAGGLTWVLRLLGWLLAWLAFFLLAGPLEVAADCIPCIGPFLGDAVSCIACCVSCLPGTACALGVIGIVWVAMRPMIGIPLLLIFAMTMCASIIFKLFFANKKSDPKLTKKENVDLFVEEPTVMGKTYEGPVNQDVAECFLRALRREYCEGAQGEVGNFFDSIDSGAAETLTAFEERVRDAGDKEGAIQDIGSEWGL